MQFRKGRFKSIQQSNVALSFLNMLVCDAVIYEKKDNSFFPLSVELGTHKVEVFICHHTLNVQ